MKTKLTPCKACGKSISRTAPKCPHCGDAPNAGGRVLLIVIAVVLILFILRCLVGL